MLRLEWFDLGAMRVPVTQCSISPQGGIRRHGDPVLLPVYDGEQVISSPPLRIRALRSQAVSFAGGVRAWAPRRRKKN